MKSVCSLGVLLFAYFTATAVADDDTRTVRSEFDRCESAMERIKRDMLRLEEAVERLKRAIEGSNSAGSAEVVQSFQKLENRVDYLRGRIDRSAGQRDKISSDLKNAGATCPSCVTSSVNLYCRNSETLTGEIEKCLADAAALEDRISAGVKQTPQLSLSGASGISHDSTRSEITAAMAKNRQLFDTCSSEAGTKLWKQCEANLRRADSLAAAGAAGESAQALRLVNLLLDKAISRCSGK